MYRVSAPNDGDSIASVALVWRLLFPPVFWTASAFFYYPSFSSHRVGERYRETSGLTPFAPLLSPSPLFFFRSLLFPIQPTPFILSLLRVRFDAALSLFSFTLYVRLSFQIPFFSLRAREGGGERGRERETRELRRALINTQAGACFPIRLPTSKPAAPHSK